ncbi:glucose-6-phosphate isomerase [Leucobacter luti]|uniref:Glucose-6-phosphate isomerase n=1 Tax=Leucobacter luti TaxID=340320 RepID=A0A4Q7TML3_9MICO|nr:glucose-6-phosphate isomerase [Leucobacter luti]MBL3700296.1 glucose-6-phosphate isomerase [Leucobacter luti]RZT60980.1 glucose-6-phosphate isomerase [Leucobacter luti]
MPIGLSFGPELASEDDRVEALVARLVADRVASRLYARDTTLWDTDAEASERLGWTDFEANALTAIAGAEAIRAELLQAGVDRIVLCGMGGSSLAPEVIARWSDVQLSVVDSTHPDFIAGALGADLARTAVVVSSKSGSTIETLSHRSAFTAAFRAAGINPADRIIVVTDPGSQLEADARGAGQRVCFADPDIGGRFSALTAFGLVPTALAGADVRGLLADACAVREEFTRDSPTNPALRLAAVIACGLPQQYVLGIAEAPGAHWGLGQWIEQLVAESTGKAGHGVLPIALPLDAPEFTLHPANLMRVELSASASEPAQRTLGRAGFELAVNGELGAQFLLWETATAMIGHLLGIDPFDQPDVESAKIAARAVLSRDADTDPAPAVLPLVDVAAAVLAAPAHSTADSAAALISEVGAAIPANGYLAIQAYLDPSGPYAPALAELRDALASAYGVPVALGWGPRYLHSVGQLHKGGPALGAFLQLCDSGAGDVEIPDSESGFGTLIVAQARGDREVLTSRGRPVFALGSSSPAELIAALTSAARTR